MSDDKETGEPKKKHSAFHGLRKVVYAFGILLIVWVIFGQAIPRFFFGDPGKGQPAASQVQSGDYDQKLELIAQHVQQLEAKVAAMENMIVSMPAPPPPPPPEGAPAPDDSRVIKLEEKITALEAQINNSEEKSAEKISAITAFNQLKETALAGNEFSAQHAALSKIVAENPEATRILLELKPYAEKGIATNVRLQKDFERTVPKALANDEGSVIGNVKSLITIRKIGEQAGNDDESILARAEAKISSGNIDGAVKELSGLTPAASAIFAPWLDEAEAIVKVKSALDSLQLALLGGKPSAATAPAE